MPNHQPEVHLIPGMRLGRRVNHDPRSRSYRYKADPAPLRSVEHKIGIPVLDQGNIGSCFPPGTRVRMADGSERRIEDVRLGESVVTAEGNLGRVSCAMLRDETAGLIRMTLWGHSHLRMTREHPVLTARGYVRAEDLLPGDEVALTRYLAATTQAIATADLIANPSHRLVRGNRWNGVQGRAGLTANAHQLPEKIQLNAGVGRLIGLFLAEGSTDASKARWSFGTHEKDTLVAETVRLLRDEWGVVAHVAERANNSTNVTVHGTAWARLLHALCGDGAGHKVLHPSLTGGSADFLNAVLDGWLSGDGHTRPDGTRNGVTISADLALCMYDIGQALGQHPVIVRSEPATNRWVATRQPRWDVSFAPGRGRCRQDDQHVWRKVRHIGLEPYSGPVYDLTVEGDHSYVAEGIGVHNCVANTGTEILSTDLFASASKNLVLDENYAQALYHDLTVADDYPGTWKPDDTGSDGVTLGKVLTSRGLISGYQHIFDMASFLAALQVQAVAVGITWRSGCDNPSSTGLIRWTGTIRGGHELTAYAYDADRQWVRLRNHWTTQWGDAGSCWIPVADLTAALAADGDATVLVPTTKPAPTPTPSPVDVDADLAKAFKAWRPGIISKITKSGALAKAGDAWLAAKGY